MVYSIQSILYTRGPERSIVPTWQADPRQPRLATGMGWVLPVSGAVRSSMTMMIRDTIDHVGLYYRRYVVILLSVKKEKKI